jgi:hypothetical protein
MKWSGIRNEPAEAECGAQSVARPHGYPWLAIHEVIIAGERIPNALACS